MSWNERLARGVTLCADFVASLPQDATLGVVGATRMPVAMSEKLVQGPTAKSLADEWLRKQTTGGGFDLKEALTYVLHTWPSVDTIVVASASPPLGDSAEDTPLEVIQEFRRENRVRRVRVHTAFVGLGGRNPQMELDEAEYLDRRELQKELAETTGGKAAVVE